MLSVRWVAGSILFFVALLSFSRITEALNGAQLVGHSAVTEAMGGAGAAAGALDNSVILTNPAALRNVSPGVRLGTLVGFPRTTFNSTAIPLGNAAAGTMTSNDDPLLKIINAVSYNLNDRISLGLAFHLNRETLATDGPTAALTETTGGGRSDASIGFGGAIGIFFKPIERLQIGASYITEQFFNEFERYQDILPRGLNYPQQVNAGLTFAPFKKLLWLLYRGINLRRSWESDFNGSLNFY